MKPPSAFSVEQIRAYLHHIQLPEQFHPSANLPRDYALLHALHVHQLAAIPYENLLLHYSQARTVSLDPQHLYQKMIQWDRGRGGYCMENCIFFNHVLRAFGFDAYTTGARIRLREGGIPWGDYVGWLVDRPPLRTHLESRG
jgi:arylamine N-acetyltransferase